MTTLYTGAYIGHYLVEQTLGSGSSSVVYLARPIEGHHSAPVALKVRARGRGKHEARLAGRFVESARLHKMFCHPNIAWFHELIENERHQIAVLEFLAGGTLTDLLRRRGGKLSYHEVCLLGAHIADGLDHMHDISVIHRDIKPDNILFASPDDIASVRIADFDVSKNPYTSPHYTEKGAHVGTLCYVSPEQFNQEKPRPASDVYSLGMLLYEAISGRLPFEPVSAAAVFSRFLDHKPLPALTQIAPEAEAGLEWVLTRALEVERAERVPSAATFATLLLALSPEARAQFSRLSNMTRKTHVEWIVNQLRAAPYRVQTALITPLREMGLGV